jgi:protochlorophyllide reductase
MSSIRAFAKRWNDSSKPIDVLSLNAGAQFVGEKKPKRTEDGFELTVGVNHLGAARKSW